MKQLGFTLIEMLVAVALTAVVMASAMQVMAGFVSSSRASDISGYPAQSHDLFVRILHADILQSDSIVVIDDSVNIISRQSIDPKTGDVTEEPVNIIYKVESYGDEGRVLVRIEQSRLEKQTINYTRGLLFFGVECIRFDSPDRSVLEKRVPDLSRIPSGDDLALAGLLEVVFKDPGVPSIGVRLALDGRLK